MVKPFAGQPRQFRTNRKPFAFEFSPSQVSYADHPGDRRIAIANTGKTEVVGMYIYLRGAEGYSISKSVGLAIFCCGPG